MTVPGRRKEVQEMTELVSKQVGNHICQVQRVWMGRCSQQGCVKREIEGKDGVKSGLDVQN